MRASPAPPLFKRRLRWPESSESVHIRHRAIRASVPGETSPGWAWSRRCLLLAYYAVIFVVPVLPGDLALVPELGLHRRSGLRRDAQLRRALEDDYFWKALKVTVIFAVAEIAIAMILLVPGGPRHQPTRQPPPALLPGTLLPTGRRSERRLDPALALALPAQRRRASTRLLEPVRAARATLPQQSGPGALVRHRLVIWTNLGGAAIILFAGINEIPPDLLEAARLDGAGLWQQTSDIILPLLRPIIFYQIVVSVIATVQMFEQFYLLNGPELQHPHPGGLHLRTRLPDAQPRLRRGRLDLHLPAPAGGHRPPVPAVPGGCRRPRMSDRRDGHDRQSCESPKGRQRGCRTAHGYGWLGPVVGVRALGADRSR